MSDNNLDSDDYPGFNLSQFTADDFAKIDADVATKYIGAKTTSPLRVSYISKSAPESDTIAAEDVHSDTDTLSIEDEEETVHRPSDVSFRSDDFSINLGKLTAEQLALLDGPAPSVLTTTTSTADKPAIEIELELEDVAGPTAETFLESTSLRPLPTTKYNHKRWHDKSPLERFRSYVSVSVTDLVGPSWCEVQYDYGLRGKRSRPVKNRPKSFVSASGKTIVPTVAVAQTNENTTRQGLKVHKELEREIKFEELKVDITTPETRWALRLVNMIACLRGILDGFTREMPVFGILHGEIVVGIMDEVVRIETAHVPYLSPDRKRSSDEPHDAQTGAKKPRLEHSPSRQRAIDSYFDSPTRKKSGGGNIPSSTGDAGPPSRPSWQVSVDRFFDNSTKGGSSSKDTELSRPKWQVPVDKFFEKVGASASSRPETPAPPVPPSTKRVGYTMQIKDNKTRRIKYMPSEADSYAGRMQLMIYRRLLSQLVATNPPYDFRPLWKKLHLDPTQIFPTKFLVQAQLIQESASVDFPVTCLDDLVESWRKVVRESGVRGVSTELELVYRLRPSEHAKGKGKAASETEESETTVEEQENLDLAKAIEESLETSGNNLGSTAHTGPATVNVQHHVGPGDSRILSEEEQLQWALQQSMLPQVGVLGESSASSDSAQETSKPSTPPPHPTEKIQAEAQAKVETKTKSEGKAPRSTLGETGIRRYEIIGTHKFAHNDEELDRHLTHVLEWWHGQRKPEGVSPEHSYRCSTCEYIDDCEWRAEKALQHLTKKKSEASLRQENS
ncbi:hypothetical protein D9619_002639 [Psilocybe cf. subviscida]|uniref:Exonuclease V n=1 Tax=Psilocybe cf. subviscida TaxID=2480587 RepID=A0A8H5AXC7_9AGAR|nr:hypothetical protein D9619_002639 [Psilocybe cf. subviscida]